jgi:hypothetical protein
MSDYICKIEPCECKPGWCPHFGCWAVARVWETLHSRSEPGDSYRERTLGRKACREKEPQSRPENPCNCGSQRRRQTGRPIITGPSAQAQSSYPQRSL